MAYIITGATGHIGNNLVKALLQQNEKVVILARKIDRSIERLDVSYQIGNIFDQQFLEGIITSEDIVLHLAGVIDIKNNQREQTIRINYEGTKTITDVCIQKKVKRYIYFSSVDAIDKENITAIQKIAEPIDMYPEKFQDNYSYSKALATKYVMEQRKKYPEIPINILYPSAVIGANDFKPSSIGKVVQDIIQGKMQFGVRGGYNFVDVDDVVHATLVLCQQEVEGDFILSGENISVYELYEIVNQHLGRKKKTWRIPLWLAYLCIPFVPYLSRFVLKTINESHNYDNTKMMEQLSITPTSFHQTIDKTIQFFQEDDSCSKR